MTTFESHPHADDTALSPAGIARRESILHDLDAAMRRRNAVRTTRRIILATAPIVLLAAFIALMMPRTPGAQTRPTGPLASAQTSLIGIVETDATIVLRLSTTVDTSSIARLTDSELQSLLASAGKPSGLIRAGGQTLTADELPPPHMNDSLPPSGDHGT